MKLRHLVLVTIGMMTLGTSYATNNSIQSDNVQPYGKPIIRVFTNFHTGFGTANDRRGFELDRSYLGYEYHLGHGLTVKGVMDIGKSSDVGDYQRIAYIKNAMLTWKHEKLTLHGGLISTTLFNHQEKFWGYRYIMKSFQDYYSFGSSADLGLSVAYRLTDWLSADAIVVNGEGYKKVQVKDGLQYGLGVTLKPVGGLTLRLYGSLNEASSDNTKDSYNLATFIGYKNKNFSLACEYNRVEHAKFLPGHTLDGVSAYGSVKLSNTITIFGRYDQVIAHENAITDIEEIKLISGLEFKIGKYIKLAPNIRYFDPKDGNKKNYCMAYINCYFGI